VRIPPLTRLVVRASLVREEAAHQAQRVRTAVRARPRSRRLIRGLLLFAGAFALLIAIDGSRQPTSGRDWRILGYQRGVGGVAAIVPLRDEAALAAAWDKLHLPGSTVPEFDRTAVFWFTATGSFGCPSHFAGFDVDVARRVVAAVFTRAFTSGCDEPTVPDSFLIAIDRDGLPPAPYRVELRDPGHGTGQAPSIEVAS
jgi:hypothetical protein